MSQSKSSKTDKAEKELMWKKLSTVHDPDLLWYRQQLGRALRGGKTGEVTVMMAGRRCGKSMMNKMLIEQMHEIS